MVKGTLHSAIEWENVPLSIVHHLHDRSCLWYCGGLRWRTFVLILEATMSVLDRCSLQQT